MATTGGDRWPISIVIIDCQDVVHAGIEAWLTGSQPPIKIVGNYSGPEEFIADHPEATPGVDTVVFALQYEGSRPQFDALRALCAGGHRVIVYSYLSTDEVILTSLDMGALTYVTKSESGNHLCAAIHAAGSGTAYVSPRMAKALLDDKRLGRPHLSKREKEVLVAWFQTENKELVAKRLFIEPSTVRSHLQRARAKYAAVGRPAPTKAALVARAIQDGILSAHDL
ncbi:response regulator transcription factor [Mycobacterium sp.]|uniref:response regulator transcription factor n=1 Tax=Mycobacterium sp. TaxID=1785 RepID=UPI002D860B0B|nr:response regulator transcription factor [Mycobacterium sp.]